MWGKRKALTKNTLKIKDYHIKDASNPREVALIVLLRVTEEKRKSHIALREALGTSCLSDRDRAFVKRCVDGCLDYLILLDALIDRYSKVRSEKQDPVIRAILRLAAYQLKFMEKVPDSAACNESVKLAKLHGKTRLSGFVNGVTRNMARDKAAGADKFYSFPKITERYSIPVWLYERLVSEFGKERAGICAENYLLERPVQVRFNLSRGTEEEIKDLIIKDGIKSEKLDIAGILKESRELGLLIGDMPDIEDPEALPVIYELSGLRGIENTEAFRRGLIQVQDLSSALAAAALRPKAGELIIDVCAAPGGKSIQLADMLCREEKGTSGKVISRDLTAEKLRLIKENISRCGFENIIPEVRDALDKDERYLQKADAVMADLPCSGLGIAGKKPDIKLNVSKEDIPELAKLQERILDTVSGYVRPGGRLVYSTCTLSHEEDEENAVAFSKRCGFKLLSMTKLLPSKRHDGFFISVFERPI